MNVQTLPFLISKYKDILKKSFVEKISSTKNFITRSFPYHEQYIIEIRAGVGGREAELFAQEMYVCYKRALLELVDVKKLGFDDVQYNIFISEPIIGFLSCETGTYRVQRIPETEAMGRVHTSTISVSFLVVSNKRIIDKIPDSEIKVEVCRSSGAGGQHVNKTESAVKITHIPTGICVYQQSERSQIMNKEKALQILMARLNRVYELKAKEEMRLQQNHDAARSTKTTTFNYKRGEMVDHRTLYKCSIDDFFVNPSRILIEKCVVFYCSS